MTSPSWNVGSIRVTPLLDGWLSLDGGAMFGVVPKVLWAEKYPADEQNRVRMPMRPLLVQTPTHTLVLEAGVGEALSGKQLGMYGIDRVGPRLDELVAAEGVDPAEVDFVAGTHLHWDHSGGWCRRTESGFASCFPHAIACFQRGEWEIATNPTNLHRASYLPETLQPLQREGKFRLFDGDGEIVPGLRFAFTPGHTENHAVIWIESGGDFGCFLGDLVPTSAHAPLAWISAYDICAGESFRTREALYPELVARDALCFLYHDPEFPVGRLVRDERGRYTMDQA